MKVLKKGGFFLLMTVFGAVLFLPLWYQYVGWSTNRSIYSDIDKIEPKKTALVLGTSKYISKGKLNYFYTYRIEAAVALYKAKKIQSIVVSGDNETKYYNEPTTMRRDIIQAGVPKKNIKCDHSGLRTLDSIIRAKELFGLDDYIIVSQRFHLQRALFIAHAKGQKAIGFAAKNISGSMADMRMIFREHLARAMAFLDLYILHAEPKYLTKREKI